MSKYALTETVSDILGIPISENRENALVRCPFHDDRHASLSVDLERGLWICFACGERGGIQSLAFRMGREVNDAELALRVYEGSRNSIFEEPKNFAAMAREQHAALRASRPDAVVEFIVSRNLRREVIPHFRLGWTGSAISFPYYDDDEVFGVKYRDSAGNKWAESGTRRGIYNLNDVRFKPIVILCEGETDTLAVWSHLTETYEADIIEKVGVGGIPGVAGSRSTWETWVLDLLWAKTVYVAFDADEAGDKGAELPLAALAGKGSRLRPPYGKDMTDFFLQGGTLDDFPDLANRLRGTVDAP